MNCRKCGAVIPDGRKFCPDCGGLVEQTYSEPAPGETQPFMENQEMNKTQEELPENPTGEKRNDYTREEFISDLEKCSTYRPVFKSLDADLKISAWVWLAGMVIFTILGFMYSYWWFLGEFAAILPFVYMSQQAGKAHRALKAKDPERYAQGLIAFQKKTKPEDVKIWFGSYHTDESVFRALAAGMVTAGVFLPLAGKSLRDICETLASPSVLFPILVRSPWFWLAGAAAVVFFVLSIRAGLRADHKKNEEKAKELLSGDAKAKNRPLKTYLGCGCLSVIVVIALLFTCFESVIKDTMLQPGLKVLLGKEIGEVKEMTRLAPATFRVEFKGDEEVRCVIWDYEKKTGISGVLLSPDSSESLLQVFPENGITGEIFVFGVQSEAEISSIQEKRIPAGCRWVLKPREFCCFEDGKKYTFFVVRNSETGTMFLSGADDASTARLSKKK